MKPPKTSNDARASERTADPDERIGQSTFAVNLQALPDDDRRTAFAAVQDRITEVLPAGVYRCPSETIHLTAFPIIWARGGYGVDVSHLWADISPIVIRSLEDIVAASPSFDLTDARIETLSAAIILRFAPSPVLEFLRDKIMKIESLDKVIAYRPNLTHITLFRFERAIPLGPLADAVSAIDPPELCWTVDRLVLQQENVYPSLQSTALAAFILGGRSKHLGS